MVSETPKLVDRGNCWCGYFCMIKDNIDDSKEKVPVVIVDTWIAIVTHNKVYTRSQAAWWNRLRPVYTEKESYARQWNVTVAWIKKSNRITKRAVANKVANKQSRKTVDNNKNIRSADQSNDNLGQIITTGQWK